MAHALRRVGPAILASGLTVALSMLVLLVADTGSISSLGPVAAIGVACVLLAGLTLLPAMLTIVGRRGFWPRAARRSRTTRSAAASEAPRRLAPASATACSQRPGLALAVTVVLFGVGALGLLAYKEDYSTTNFFKKQTESVDGFDALEKAFPAGTLSNPTTVLVEREDGPVRREPTSTAGAGACAQCPGWRRSAASQQRSRDGRIAALELVFEDDPYTDSALEACPGAARPVDRTLPPARDAWSAAARAVQYDFDKATSRDLKVIVPLGAARDRDDPRHAARGDRRAAGPDRDA